MNLFALVRWWSQREKGTVGTFLLEHKSPAGIWKVITMQLDGKFLGLTHRTSNKIGQRSKREKSSRLDLFRNWKTIGRKYLTNKESPSFVVQYALFSSRERVRISCASRRNRCVAYILCRKLGRGLGFFLVSTLEIDGQPDFQVVKVNEVFHSPKILVHILWGFCLVKKGGHFSIYVAFRL